LIQRPEIKAALLGIPSTAIRRLVNGQRVLYAAAPIQNNSAPISGLVYIATPLPASGLPGGILFELFGAVLLAALVAFVAGRYLSRQIARPLEELASAADSIAAGNLTTRLPSESTITELNNLGRRFNDMVEALRRSDEVKKTFIADVTHELRTPLTVIKGTIETLEDGALDDAEGRGPLLGAMQRETDRLIRMVNELLVLTRADAGSLRLEVQPLDLTAVVEERCEFLSTLSKRENITLAVERPPERWHVLADRDRLAQILDNLLDNALRHSPVDSIITVSIRSDHGSVACSVTDRGTGIPAHHLPLIFERFYRVDRSRTRKDGGTGLGLAIVRSLVQAMSGQVSAESTVDQGTTITFWLPQAAKE
jgi:signal transduction histidine kinase